jgi:hypothetical protein
MAATLFDIIVKVLPCVAGIPPHTCAIKTALELATKMVNFIGFGFSIDHSIQIDLEHMGLPPLTANARRRTTPSAGTEKDGAATEQYTCDKEYYWQCKHHQTFAFPEENFDDGRPPYDAHCKKLNGNIWMGVSVDLMKVFELPQSLSPEANKKSGGRIKDENAAKLKRKNAQNLDDTAYQRSKKVLKEKVFDFSPEPFSLSDLFSLSFDLNVVFSVDNLKKMAGDMKTMIVPALAFGMWMLLWTIEFSIMCTGSVSFGILLGSFSGGLFNDWYIKLGCLLVYFRKGSKAIAFYITYSKGDLANDMQTVFPIKSNLPGVKEEAQKLHKNFLKDDMDDAMGGADFQVDEFLKVGMLPSGMQKQFYGILHGCDGSFPRISCETGGAGLSAKNIGFGFKTVILLGGDNGFSVYVEKPLEDPKDKKSDSFLFCVGALGEEFCINLGFLLFLLNCLAALADVVLALANWIGGRWRGLDSFLKTSLRVLQTLSELVTLAKTIGCADATTVDTTTGVITETFLLVAIGISWRINIVGVPMVGTVAEPVEQETGYTV